ncbi:hypothetical protein BDR03DRAFT_944546 [Suillus americanus]|nr:hypothetical protein BDR03DRAFT_944546 [Suillus americanus]
MLDTVQHVLFYTSPFSNQPHFPVNHHAIPVSSSKVHLACSYCCWPLSASSSAVCNVFSPHDMSCIVHVHQSSIPTAICLLGRSMCCYLYTAQCQTSPHLHHHFVHHPNLKHSRAIVRVTVHALRRDLGCTCYVILSRRHVGVSRSLATMFIFSSSCIARTPVNVEAVELPGYLECSPLVSRKQSLKKFLTRMSLSASSI